MNDILLDFQIFFITWNSNVALAYVTPRDRIGATVAEGGGARGVRKI